MSGESMYNASKGRMAPELMFSSEHTLQLSKTASKPLCFTFSYVQPITQRYKQRTVLELSLQSMQSPQKIQTIPVYKCTVGKPCIVLP